MKKILFVCHSASMGGGVGKVLDVLIDELRNEYEIDILERLEDLTAPFVHRRGVRKLCSMSYTTKYAIKYGNNVLLNRMWRAVLPVLLLCVPRLMYRFYIKEIYDYEISFNYLYPSYLISKSPNRNSKKIMWFHGSIEDLDISGYTGKRRILYSFYYQMQKSALEKADCIVAISNRTAQSIQKLFPWFKQKISLIYNGYDLNRIREIGKSITDKRNSFKLIYVGRLDKNKNVGLQIRAIKELVKKGNIHIELFIVGEGDMERELKELAQAVSGKVHFLGFITNPYIYINDADALILTSYSEGFPTVIVEAMALGKPVISTPVAGSDELITEETGCIVDWRVDSVVEGILNMMSKKFDKEKIQQFVDQYTKERWGQVVKRMLKQLN